MILGYSLKPFGHHPAAWQQSRDRHALQFEALLGQVIAAEAGGFDFILLADRLGLRPVDDLSSVATPFEPTLLASALATRAGRIGFIAAASTTQHEPYNLARRFASLDWISKGRMGWLALSHSPEPGHDREYLDLVSGLWDSWEDDAFSYDKASGRFFEPAKMHVLNHREEYFSVRGPLNVNRSPQGRPVLAQLLNGGILPLALQTVELLLIDAGTPEGTVEMAQEAARLIEAAGRKRADARIVVNVVPFVGATNEEARSESEKLGFSEANRLEQPLAATRLAGTPAEIADMVEGWMQGGALDGVTILPPTLQMAQRFLGDVVPELRRRGLVGEKAGGSLRDRLGLKRPAHPAATMEQAS